jgi:two-component system, sensor histidine kinase
VDLSGGLATTLLELAPDPTVVVDHDGRIVFANAQVESTFGYSAAELLGSRVEVLLPPRFRDVHPLHRGAFAASPKPRPMGAGLELYALHKAGHEFPVQISLSPVATPEGLLVVSSIRDATVQKHAERRLIEENKAKSRFLAAASHDLRQPLQTLNLLNRVASREAGDNKALQGVLEGQQRALDSMSQLLASVLDISKLDSGAFVPNPGNVALADLFERLRSDFEPQAVQKDLRLVVEHRGAAAYTDAELLRRLLGNLISNAIRYTREGEVRLTCTPRDAAVAIEVTDTGIGIVTDEMERIFEEFYQIDHGSQRPEGLGLGLSIVRRLATLLELDLDVRSTPGIGTQFTVTAPLGRLEAPAALRGRAAAACPRGGRILIVDDEPEVAEATKLLLQLEGFEVAIASSAHEALDYVREAWPDLIVSDYHLRGGETGVSVVQSVRAQLARPIPVVFVTGDTAKPANADARIENARVLSKPLRADDLLTNIDALLASQDSAGAPPN